MGLATFGHLMSVNDPKADISTHVPGFRGGVARTSAVFCASVSSSPTWLLDASFLARRLIEPGTATVENQSHKTAADQKGKEDTETHHHPAPCRHSDVAC